MKSHACMDFEMCGTINFQFSFLINILKHLKTERLPLVRSAVYVDAQLCKSERSRTHLPKKFDKMWLTVQLELYSLEYNS